MKTHSHPRLVTIFAVSALLLIYPRASAQTEETAWTTKEGTTYWARLGGWDGKQVILMVRGRELRMPVGRLSPGSLAKACQMLDLSESRIKSAAAGSQEPATPLPVRPTAAPVPFDEYYASVPPLEKTKASETTTLISDIQSARTAAPADEPNLPRPEMAAGADLGKRVLEFCGGRIGEKVGNGQCATLAVQALSSAGARGMGRDAPHRGDYVWGRQVALIEADRKGVKGLTSLTHVKPGDLIQFRDVRLEGVNRSGGAAYWMSAPHHTAVVAAVEPDRATLVVYHQNWGRKTVRQDRMELADLKKGWLRIYRPMPRER